MSHPGATNTTVGLTLTAKDESEGAFASVKEKLESLKSILETAFVWRAGEMIFDTVKEGIEDFVHNLIGANEEVETLKTSLTALYGSATEAGQAIEFMTQFSLKAPFSKGDIEAAGQEMVSFGQDITSVLPAVGNVAAAMGVAIPAATDALEKAVNTGSLRSLTSTLHITKQELIDFGAQVTASGALVQSSILPAFEALSAAKFGDGMASQLHTVAGVVTNLRNVFDNLQETVGEGLFARIETGLTNFDALIQKNQEAITSFGEGIGNAMGVAAGGAGAALGAIGSVFGDFVNWFTGAALPMIENGLGQMAIWWQQNGATVETAITNIWARVKDFGSLVVSGLGETWSIVAGDIKFFWDYAQSLFALGQDAITGNWSSFGTDLTNGIRRLAADAVGIFAAMFTGVVDLITRLAFSVAEAMVPVANDLLAPMAWVAQKFRDVFLGMGQIVSAFIGSMARVGDEMAQPFIDGINKMIGAIKDANALLSKIPDMGFGAIKNMGFVPNLNPDADAASAQSGIMQWFNQHAPGLAHTQTFNPTGTTAQAQAALEATRRRLVQPFDDFVNSVADKFKSVLDPNGEVATKGNADATTLGKNILANLFGAFSVHGDLKGDAGKLPATYLTDGTDPASIVVAALKSPATSGSGASANGRVSLGYLGADYGQVVVGAGIQSGSSPAERLAQRQADAVEKTTSEATRQTTLQKQIADQGAATLRAIEHLGDLLARSVTPNGMPVHPLQAKGTLRPTG